MLYKRVVFFDFIFFLLSDAIGKGVADRRRRGVHEVLERERKGRGWCHLKVRKGAIVILFLGSLF